MGMFENYPNFDDCFNVGDRFTLEGAKLGAILNTEFGESQQVLFKIKSNGETKVYSALGAGFVGQATRAEAKDFPVEVEYCHQPAKVAGRSDTKILWPVGVEKPWEKEEVPF